MAMALWLYEVDCRRQVQGHMRSVAVHLPHWCPTCARTTCRAWSAVG